MTDTFFTKRADANDLGRLYENIVTANVAFDLVIDEEIDEFHLSSNDDAFGVFDDLVLEVKPVGKVPNFFAFQLKHSENRRLTIDNFKTGRDFLIKKYFENFESLLGKNISFFSSYKLVIFTNRNFHAGEDSRIRLTGEDFDIKITKCKPDPLLAKYGAGNVYKFECDKNNERATKYRKFFDNFFLYTNQYDVDQFQRNIFDKFQRKFRCDESFTINYLNFITQWGKKSGKKLKLNKNMVKQAIAICLFSPFIRQISPQTDDLQPKSQLLLNAIHHFDATHCTRNDFDPIAKILGKVFTKLDQKLSEVNDIGRKFQIIPYSVKKIEDLGDLKCNKLAWLMDLCPLVLNGNDTVYEGVKLCHHKPIIVVHDTPPSLNLSLFRCLWDLKTHPSLYEEILDVFTCKLQGKEEMTLRRLVGLSEETETLIKTSHLLHMIDSPLRIGEDREDMPVPHISSHLSRHIIDNAFLKAVDPDETVIINSEGDCEEQNDFLFDFEGDQRFFNSLCYDKPKAHQFRMFDDKLEWIRSKGKINELKKFQKKDDFVEVSDLLSFESDNNVNIVCADAGMGKTTLLKNMKNNYSSDYWTILICPKNHFRYFRQRCDDVDKFLQYILEKTCGNDIFLNKLLKVFRTKCKINFLWDGLDEISQDNFKTVINIIDKLAQRGFRQWLTSRRNHKSVLEDRFNVLARTVKPFGEEEQKNYMKDKLKCSEDIVNRLYDKISRNMQLFRYNEILGVPLQMYMFTELLLQNMEKYNKKLDDVFSLADLFQHFVEERFQFHHRERENSTDFTDEMYERNREYDKEQIEGYQKAAIKLHFPAEILKQLKNKDCEAFLGKIKKGKDPLGIITHVSEDNIPDFYHSSYGEYFAALYLSKNCRQTPKLAFIFDSVFDNIRFFFDLILAKNCPAHLAVLYKNIDVLEQCEETDINRKDAEGRYPLHLACSWGERYPFLPTKTFCFWVMCCRVVVVEPQSVKADISEYRQIIEFLSERNDPNENDDLFNMNSFSYCAKSRGLLPFEILSNTYKVREDATILYYASILDLTNILENLKPLPLVATSETTGYESILLVAVKHASINFLKKILSFRNYRNIAMRNCPKLLTEILKYGNCDILRLFIDTFKVDATTLEKLLLIVINDRTPNYSNIIPLLIKAGAIVNTGTALYCACVKNNYPIAEMLLSYGAEINATLLRLVCEKNFYEIAQLLLENGVNVHEGTPIYIASVQRNYKMCELLISHGACIDEQNAEGMALIHFICQDGDLNMLEMLIQKGADVNICNKEGETPLHLACKRGRYRVVQILLSSGIQVNCLDDEGLTPLHIACTYGHLKVVKMLIRNGAKVNICCYNGETALDKAADERIEELLKQNNGEKGLFIQ